MKLEEKLTSVPAMLVKGLNATMIAEITQLSLADIHREAKKLMPHSDIKH